MLELWLVRGVNSIQETGTNEQNLAKSELSDKSEAATRREISVGVRYLSIVGD